jgi:hypothetical protein
MTDEEMEAIRGAASAYAPSLRIGTFRIRDVRALLAEVDRLRAREPRHAEEAWLAELRACVVAGHEDAAHSNADVQRLLKHLDATDGLLNDMQTDAGAMLAHEAGMAEERARIEGEVVSLWEWFIGQGDSTAATCGPIFKAVLARIGRTAAAELLPPAAARLEADRQRWRAERCREALEEIARRDSTEYMDSLETTIARKALEETQE